MKDKLPHKPQVPTGKTDIKQDMGKAQNGRKTPSAPTFLKPPPKKS
ncbi:hypothetical protein [Chryseobacterium sp. KMC2]|nr:hypothetical protein [Chryseobacterium sp. KMC2]MBL3547235.1 hypothetical protein [Chryseobacterium sp. KMC2]